MECNMGISHSRFVAFVEIAKIEHSIIFFYSECPTNPPYPGDECFRTAKDLRRNRQSAINTDCEYILEDIKTDCKNCGCDDGPSSFCKCGEKINEEKIKFTCGSVSTSGKGIWHPVVGETSCQNNGENYDLNYGGLP